VKGGDGGSDSCVSKPWSGTRVGYCRVWMHLRRPFILGKNLNMCGRLKSRVRLVAFCLVIGQHGMDVEGWIVVSGGTNLWG